MADLKDSWKDTGKSLGGAFKNLGKTIIRSAETGVDKAVEWADKDDAKESGDPERMGYAVCPSCNNKNAPDSKFCTVCGAKLIED